MSRRELFIFQLTGNATYKAKETQKSVDEIIQRFMQLRTPNWGWESVSTISAIQMAAPKRLFGRGKSKKALRSYVRYEWDK